MPSVAVEGAYDVAECAYIAAVAPAQTGATQPAWVVRKTLILMPFFEGLSFQYHGKIEPFLKVRIESFLK